MRTGLLVVAGLMVAACSSVPAFVEGRPSVTMDCAPTQSVFLPTSQSPDEYKEASVEALTCFVRERDLARSAELTFTLLGTEGERYDAVLQTLTDGTTNYYHESDEGWVGSEGCGELTWPDPGIPDIDDCSNSPP